MHPHECILLRPFSNLICEPLVDTTVMFELVIAEYRVNRRIMIERPSSGVTDTIVKAINFFLRHSDFSDTYIRRVLAEANPLVRATFRYRASPPAHPCCVYVLQGGLKRTY